MILCSHTAYADENIPSDLGIEGSVSDPSIPISAEDDYILREGSKQIADLVYSTSDVRATDYAQQIYNYLVNTIHSDLTTIGTRQNTTNTRLSSILACLNGNSSTNTYLYDVVTSILYDGFGFVPNSATGGYLNVIANQLSYQTISPSSNFTLMDMMFLLSSYYVDGAGSGYSWDSMGANLATISANSGGNIIALQAISTKLDNYINCSDIVWTTVSDVTFYGASASYDINTQFVNTAFDSDVIMLKFSIPNTVVNSVFSRISLPIDLAPNMNLKVTMLNTTGKPIEFEYFVAGRTLYLLGFPKYFGSTAYLFLDAGENEIYFNPSRTFKIDTTSSNNIEAIQKISNFALMDINHKLRFLEDIEKVIANEDIEQAREESSPTTKQALDDFTGDGSSAVTPSDVSSASDISDTVSAGVDAGGAVSDALTVFSPASDIYMWFSQDNKNYFIPLDVNYPSYYNPSTDTSLPVYIDYATHELIINGVHYPLYPNPIRGSSHSTKSNNDIQWTDDVPDVLTFYNQQVQSQIGDDK